MKENKEKSLQDILNYTLEEGKRLGAEHVEVAGGLVEQFTRSHRNRIVETHERGESKGLTLRVFVNNRPAVTTTNRWDRDAITTLCERAVAIAKEIPEDTEALPAEHQQVKQGPHDDFDCYDPSELDESLLIKDIDVMEQAALSIDEVRTLDSVSASYQRGIGGLAMSNGFFAIQNSSHYSYALEAMAQRNDERQVSWDYDVKTHYKDLVSPEEVGRKAAVKAARKLGARKIGSQRMAIFFDREISGSIVGELISAINGYMISRGLSFLQDSLGEKLFNEQITITDDPHRSRGLASRAFDAEGLPTQKLSLVKDGVLKHWLLDLRSARRLRVKPQGNAGGSQSRRPGPSASNVTMAAGALTRDALLSRFDQAILVRECMGQGGNTLTGDFSIGISGHLLEKGEEIAPVQELTIGGSLKEIFQSCICADDLKIDRTVNAPTLYIGEMVVGGQSNT